MPKIQDYCPHCRAMFPNAAFEPNKDAKRRRLLFCVCPICDHSLEPLLIGEDGHVWPSTSLAFHVREPIRELFRRRFWFSQCEIPELIKDRVVFLDTSNNLTGSWKDWEVPYSLERTIRDGYDGFVLSSGTNAGAAFVLGASSLPGAFDKDRVHIVIPEHAKERFLRTLKAMPWAIERPHFHFVGSTSGQAACKAEELAESGELPLLSGWAPWGRRWGFVEMWRDVLRGFVTCYQHNNIDQKAEVAYFQGVAGALGAWAMSYVTRQAGAPWTPFLCSPANSSPFAQPRQVYSRAACKMTEFEPICVGNYCFGTDPSPVNPVLDSKVTNAEQDVWHKETGAPCVCLENEEILDGWKELRWWFPHAGLEAGTAWAGYRKVVKEAPELLKDKRIVVNLTGRYRPGDEELF